MAKKKRNISSWIFGGLIFGIIAGALVKLAPGEWQEPLAQQIQPLGSLFNRIIFMVVIPIIFCSLVSGIATLGSNKIGKIGISYYKLSIMMVITGLIIAFAFSIALQPGKNSHAEATTKFEQAAPAEKKPILQKVVEFVPSNPLEAMVNSSKGGLIPVMIFAVFFGFALAKIQKDSILRKLNDEVLAVSIKIVDFALLIAPFSIFVLMFTTVINTGFDLMASLLSYIAVVIGALFIMQFVVFGAMLVAIGKSPLAFFRDIREVIATAMATASAAVTTPVAMRVAEENLKLNGETSRLVLTLGMTGAKTGTSMFQAIAAIFIAQLSGFQFEFEHYAIVAFTCFVSGIVTAGTPGASIPVVAGILATLGIPAEAIGIIIAIDRILDMLRTTVNATGNMVIAQYIDKEVAKKKSKAAKAAA